MKPSGAELNRDCLCISLDEQELQRHFAAALRRDGVLPALLIGREHLFAPYPVFADRVQLDAMRATIEAAYAVFELPDFRSLCAGEDTPAWPEQHTRSAMMAFDFHPVADGARLIEINTNAGGGFLAALLAESQRACCDAVREAFPWPQGGDAAQAWSDDFRAEWRLARGERPLRRLLIVDDEPEQQFLYPEFLLFRALFRRQGIECAIADPRELGFDGARLLHAGEPVDMVYNRLTDFTLAAPPHAVLRAALLADAVVVTPSPAHHALYADKRNLVFLSDEALLARIGADAATRALLLRNVPRARFLDASNADELWAQRRRLFFKPRAGYGSRGAYRGERITRRVWQEIVAAGTYIAQEFTPPPLRRTAAGLDPMALKFDLRCLSYGTAVRLVTARLYQGQTTNLRTARGGLASVFVR